MEATSHSVCCDVGHGGPQAATSMQGYIGMVLQGSAGLADIDVRFRSVCRLLGPSLWACQQASTGR
jgi:hypothetical protein